MAKKLIFLSIISSLIMCSCLDQVGGEGQPCNQEGLCQPGLFCNEDNICSRRL
jgi:hypothetical protein